MAYQTLCHEGRYLIDFTGEVSSHGRKNSITTAPPITTTPQNFASRVRNNIANTTSMAGTAMRHMPRKLLLTSKAIAAITAPPASIQVNSEVVALSME